MKRTIKQVKLTSQEKSQMRDELLQYMQAHPIQEKTKEQEKNTPNGMCMLTKTMAELTSEHQDIIDVTASFLGQIESAFEGIIKEAQEAGEIPMDRDAAYLASYVQIQIAGLRSYAKTNNDKQKLAKMIDDLFIHYPF